MINFLKTYKFTLVNIILTIIMCFIGTIGHIIFAVLCTTFVSTTEIYCNYKERKTKKIESQVEKSKKDAENMFENENASVSDDIQCYRKEGCSNYEMRSCTECPASKPEYLKRYRKASDNNTREEDN